MYEDIATIRRYEDVDKPNGSTKNEPVIIYRDQPCHISQKALGVNNQKDAQNNIAYETKLFISPELDIHQGDVVEIKRGTLSREFTAGEPFPYPTHQEVALQRKGYA
ncbi:ABC transporter ATP-binding protein [Paenibacillus larvae subsp. pulvifaciens]|uniref:ABC transporter ATP-binding protein n=2 Tax=Paenibacillus larvae TaxID=1464 RepID=A0A1V0UZA3_9BACL|nr:ABC transporter ATP-binding protein [Paenibacillus larvae subsp. pulvifaciens]ARF70378.1 ABC transporter ATP-binding protein [Paenibacillus larvae subsp. pulvifaciens]ARF70587.1 ABC transporter ATP-binding protein [Paenibacillus larvae subsp. pulvifaciens]ARF70598.1 ABC transporter ATP-binding protein [Paenibacillus larvae subsp. pulvifaciens]